jgi:hypothetical protein
MQDPTIRAANLCTARAQEYEQAAVTSKRNGSHPDVAFLAEEISSALRKVVSEILAFDGEEPLPSLIPPRVSGDEVVRIKRGLFERRPTQVDLPKFLIR